MPTVRSAMMPGHERIPVSRVQTRAEEMISRHGFLGVPMETFQQAGREQLVSLLNEGMNPESKIVEIGCGCLRIAYWLLRFLDPGCYHGIEPARERVEYGLRYLFDAGEVELKRPRFDFNPRFDTSVFCERFDFFLARSIWTHASKGQISAMLDSFIRDSKDTGVFLVSYLPAQQPDEDYGGDGWVGTSHESNVPGVIRHSLEWILAECEKRELHVDQLPGIDCDSQSWLRLRKRNCK